MNEKKIIVIGAGIAGLSAAASLASKNLCPVLFESSAKIGGRCYSFTDKTTGEIIDNGQHLMMGAYKSFLTLTDIIGTREMMRSIYPMSVRFNGRNGENGRLDTSYFPGLPGMLAGLLFFSLLNFKDKLHLIKLISLIRFHLAGPGNETVFNFLKKYSQTSKSIEYFWEPLTLATINASIESADAFLLCQVVRKAFRGGRDSAFLIPRTGLSEILAPLPDYIESAGGELILRNGIKKIVFTGRKAAGVVDAQGNYHAASSIITAVPETVLKNILPQESHREFFFDRSDLEWSTIISAYLWYDQDFFAARMSAMLGTNSQWIFNRRALCNAPEIVKHNYPGHYEITISAADKLINMNRSEIVSIIDKELKQCFLDANEASLLHSSIFINKRATPLLTPENRNKRQSFQSPYKGLYIAGDWTDTRLPATIESAAFSGFEAARLVKKNHLKDK